MSGISLDIIFSTKTSGEKQNFSPSPNILQGKNILRSTRKIVKRLKVKMGKGDREHAVSRGGHGSPEVTSEQNPEGEGASLMDFPMGERVRHPE